MATLRPLFITFLSRSRLLGSSTRGTGSQWGPYSSRKGGYFRSGGGNDNAPEELGLSGLQKGSGVSTTVQSVMDTRGSDDKDRGTANIQNSPKQPIDETFKRIQRFGSRRGEGAAPGTGAGASGNKQSPGRSGTWNSDVSRLTEDSSSEDGVNVNGTHKSSAKSLQVFKTTEVFTKTEWRQGAPVGVAVSTGGAVG